MHFTYPLVLWALLVVPLLGAVMLWAQARRRRAVAAFAGTVLADKLARGISPVRRGVKGALTLAAVGFLVLACARPRWGMRVEEVHRQGLDLLIGLDVSNSMLAEDIQPSRLARAKMEIAGLLDRLGGDQVGLIAFAGVAFLQCPLTVDYSAARMLLDAMSPDLIPVGGTALSEAIRVAMQAYSPKDTRYKVLVLITDGEDNTADPEPIAKEAAKAGIRIYTIGVGRPDGQPIPIRDASGAVTSYRKDSKGEVVRSKLDAATLSKIANATGGRFYQATLDQDELATILKDIQGLERRELKGRSLGHLEDRYQLFVLLALICLAIEALIPERARETGEWGGRFA